MAHLMFLDDIGSEMLYVTKCPLCGRETSVKIDAYDWMLYEQGEDMPVAFPNLSRGQREVILSGTCDECWDKMRGN